MTTVTNVKVKYIRPKYDNLKEWRKDPENVYIGRKGIVFINGVRYPKKDSIWHNPFKITDECDRDECLKKYKKYIKKKLEEDPELLVELLKLEGKNLGCWCAPESCHGDILVKLIKKYS